MCKTAIHPQQIASGAALPFTGDYHNFPLPPGEGAATHEFLAPLFMLGALAVDCHCFPPHPRSSSEYILSVP